MDENTNDTKLVMHPSGVRLWRGKRYVMITLVSEQPTPNIIPFFQSGAPKFDQIFFIYTAKFKYLIDSTMQVLDGHFRGGSKVKTISEENIDLGLDAKGNDNATDSRITFDHATSLIKDLKHKAEAGNYSVVIVCNWTLGTKPMSSGLYGAATRNNCPTLYVDSQNKRLLLTGEEDIYPEKSLAVQLSVKEYLGAYGLNASEGNSKPDLVQASFKIIDAMLIPSNGLLNSHAALTERYSFFHAVKATMSKLDSNKLDINLALGKNANQGLDYAELDAKLASLTNARNMDIQSLGFLKLGLADYKKLVVTAGVSQATDLANALGSTLVHKVTPLATNKLEVELVSLSTLHFLHGAWLEYYVYGKLVEQIPLRQWTVARNVSFNWNDPQKAENYVSGEVKNELDVLLMSGVEMAFISCKSGGTLHKEGHDINEPIYHMETNVRKIVASGASIFSNKKFLVICEPELTMQDASAFRKRAKLFGIELVALEELPKIADMVAKKFKLI
jgi:hypothetical protein